jgi:hypothetical protein
MTTKLLLLMICLMFLGCAEKQELPMPTGLFEPINHKDPVEKDVAVPAQPAKPAKITALIKPKKVRKHGKK